MFDTSDLNNLWVSPDSFGGDGTWEKPFSEIEQALGRVQPGNTIVLKDGVYEDDLTIQVSGTTHKPIKIVAQEKGKVEIHGACWFLYDVCDLIISDLVFKNSPQGAISVVGACKRNRFNDIHFVNCGTARKASCTMFFGGAGAQCNLVEDCIFEQEKPESFLGGSSKEAIVGLMVTDGDGFDGDYIKNHVFRRNHFINYQHGILLGSGNSLENQSGHVVEYNTLENCLLGGITTKCSDTLIRGNLIAKSKNNSISVQAGTGSIVENNRIVDSVNGIIVYDFGHTVENNCVVRCKGPAIVACKKSDGHDNAANNLLVEKNTCINCGTGSQGTPVAGIRVEQDTTCIVRKNLFYGEGVPCEFALGATAKKVKISSYYMIEDNGVSGKCVPMDGFFEKDVSFTDENTDNFENDSGYGAQGWMLKPETFDPEIDKVDDSGVDYRKAVALNETMEEQEES